ncbi:MAG TPA: hypothetical protein VN205_07325 [Thermomonas sp.]|nr:hypothetical protein [Thermomonas sp.]
MTRHPPQPLDAEERALAALLPRAHGRGEPDAELDARILAASRASVRPTQAPPRRRSWIAPTALAASLVLAVGLAWQLRPPPAPVAQEPPADGASADTEVMAMRSIEAPPASPGVTTPSMPSPMVQARPVPATVPPAEADGERMAAPIAAADIAEVAAAPAAPPPPPAPRAAAIAGDAGSVQPSAEPARAPALAKARASEAVRDRSQVSGNAAAQAEDAAQRAAADAATLDSVIIADDPGEDVPPATADSPEVRDAWLRRIGELQQQGKTEEAKASLAEFKRRYPEAILPPELRKLEP